jgi:coenzyme F420-reducing hydrogenase alpha subunit
MNNIRIDHMAKIYGHASLEVMIRNRQVKQCQLHIVESSRFFERMMKGKRFDEARRLASRICGICSASHNITAIMAAEDALGINPLPQVKAMREALILGGYIQSHALHLYFLALPDYMGYSGILDMADKYPEYVDRAFSLKKLGNTVIEVLGGRPCHPVTTNVGRFTNIPEKEQMDRLLAMLKKGMKDAQATVKLFGKFRKPNIDLKKQMGALVDGEDYAILSGNPVIGNKTIQTKDFMKSVNTEERAYSTSKFVTHVGEHYMVGPLARMNANHRHLSDEAESALKRSKMKLPDYNSFNANIARAVEIVHCIEKCIKVIKGIIKTDIEPKALKKFDFKQLKGNQRGCAITEAPRGMLYHEYNIGKDGYIIDSVVMTPTAQNLNPIESDVRAFLPTILNHGRPNKQKIIIEIEKLIRSYDPCISCATHFLDVKFA